MIFFIKKLVFILIISIGFASTLFSQKQVEQHIICGAERTDIYIPLLKNKTVAVFANQTSMVGRSNLIDTLLKLGINIKAIFSPEHGFRGNAAAGSIVGDYTDGKTGVKIISLYGKKTKPTAEDLAGIDVMLFDIQDVGVRFYTYISSLQFYMESAFENNIPLLILDRPNPNSFYVDGPVLDTSFRSFVGEQPVPIVYGMTIGEYAQMIAGERWLSTEKANAGYDEIKTMKNDGNKFHFMVIKCLHYTHKSKYVLPVKPSPNLPFINSIYHYPYTCFFEGSVISEGRGTARPFEIFGHPSLPKNLYKFIPQNNAFAKDVKFNKQLCFGWNISSEKSPAKIDLQWLIKAYQLFPNKKDFFLKTTNKNTNSTSYFFNSLAGNDVLMQQIISGKTEAEIRASWQPKLQAFKNIRAKYLLYAE